MLGRELSLEEVEQRFELVRAAKTKELCAWKQFDVFEPRRDRNVSKQVAQTRWVLNAEDGGWAEEYQGAFGGEGLPAS